MAGIDLKHIEVDHIWKVLGPWGLYQWKQLSSYLFICVSWSIHQLSIVFIGYRPNFLCKAAPNASIVANVSSAAPNAYTVANLSSAIRREYKECSIDTYVNTSSGEVMTSTGCAYGWEYDIPKEQSFVTEWDFVCSHAELAELTQTLLILGMMLGTFICPTLADKLGRKPVMVFSHVILFAIVIGTSFSPNYYVFIVLRILTGAVSQGALSGTTLALETFPKEVRHYTEPLALATWTTALCVMSPIAYALRNVSWRYLQVTYALLSAWSIFQWWMLDESLRWVIANGQLDRARQILKNACKWNKKDYNKVLDQVGLADITLESEALNKNGVSSEKIENVDLTNPTVTSNGNTTDYTEETVKKYNVLDIFKHKHIRRVSFILWYTWVVDSLAYYGLFMISADLYGDRYVNFFLIALIEYPASVFEFYALGRIGRKWTCVICHLVGAVGLIIATIATYTADGNTTLLACGTAFTLIGKMGITGAFSSAYVVTPELYPTNLRNSGLGVASFMGKVGGMIAPFSRNVSHTTKWLPGAIYAALCLSVIFLFAFVPETNGVELPQTMDELTEWYRVQKFELKIGKNRHTGKTTGVEINIPAEKEL